MLLTHIPSTTASYCEDADDGNSSSPNQPSSSLLVSSIFSITADQQVEQEFEQFKQSLDHQMLLETTANSNHNIIINSNSINSNINQSMEHHRHQAHHQQSQVKRELLMTINVNDKQGPNYSPRVCASCNNCITDDFYLRTTPVSPPHLEQVKRETGQQQQEESKYGTGNGIGNGNCLSWHTNRGCLRCSRCGQPLEGQSSCFMSNGNILCKSDYEYLTSKENSSAHEDQWMLPPRYRCFRCFAFFGPSEFVIKVPTPNGQCLMNGPWMFFHPNCFSCEFCGKQLNKGNLYSLQGTNVLCPLHAGKKNAVTSNGSRTCKGNKDASSVTRSPLCQTSSFSMSRSAPVKSPKKRGPKAGSTRGPRSKKLLSSLVGEATSTSTSTTAARNVSPVMATSEVLASAPTAVSPSASCTSSSFQFSQANPSRKYDSTSTKNVAASMVKEDSGYSDTASTAGVLTVLTNSSSFSSSSPSSSLSSTSSSHSTCLYSPSYIRSPSSPSSSVSSASCLLLSPARHHQQQSQGQQGNPTTMAQQTQSHSPGQAVFKERTKRSRTSFKNHQLKKMKEYFRTNQNPDSNELKKLSTETNLPKRVLQVWFQNARAKWRRSILKQSSLGPHVVEECKPLAELTPSSTGPTNGDSTIVNSNTDLNTCHPSHNPLNPFLSPVDSPATESLNLDQASGQQMSTFSHSSDHQPYGHSNSSYGHNYSNGGINSGDHGQSDCSHFGIPLHHGAPHNSNPASVPSTSSPATNVTTSSSPSASSTYGPSVMAHFGVTF